MEGAQSSQRPEMVPHCLMCGALIQRGEGVIKWKECFPFMFCSRECQLDYGVVNARRSGFGHDHGRGHYIGLYHSQERAAVAVQ